MIFRACPKCGATFDSEGEWVAETKPVPDLNENRTVVSKRDMKERYQINTTLIVGVREHHCGGQMYDEGMVTGVETVRF